MNWLQLILLVLKLLKQAKSAETAESFAVSTGAVGANGEFLKWLWEHRQQLLDFILPFFKGPQLMESNETTAEIRSLVEELK